MFSRLQFWFQLRQKIFNCFDSGSIKNAVFVPAWLTFRSRKVSGKVRGKRSKRSSRWNRLKGWSQKLAEDLTQTPIKLWNGLQLWSRFHWFQQLTFFGLLFWFWLQQIIFSVSRSGSSEVWSTLRTGYGSPVLSSSTDSEFNDIKNF